MGPVGGGGSGKQRIGRMNGFEILEAEIESQVEQGTEIPYLWLLACKRGFGPRKPRNGAKGTKAGAGR